MANSCLNSDELNYDNSQFCKRIVDFARYEVKSNSDIFRVFLCLSPPSKSAAGFLKARMLLFLFSS